MNMSSQFVAACFVGAMITSAAAFSLDAAGYEGGVLEPNPCSIWVPGYGEVVFETGIGTPLAVHPAYGNGNGCNDLPVRFVGSDAVKLTVGPTNIADEGSSFRAFPQALEASDDVVESSNGWHAIPEPATAGLGLAGLLILVLGRYR